MAGIDVGGSGGRGRRATNSDINMIPFIDLLMVTIAFLLITAVWVTSSRIDTTADVPGQAGCGAECGAGPSRVLHVYVRESDVGLEWHDGKTVVRTATVPKQIATSADGAVRYVGLDERVRAEWSDEGVHKSPTDHAADEAVLHTENSMPFKEMVAALDALTAPHREIHDASGRGRSIPAFHVVLAER